MHCLIMFGSPGSGKGTQSKLLPMTHISTGDVLRGSAIGQKFLEENPGKLFPDTMMDRIVQDTILRKVNGEEWYILDGYPRTVAQADVLIEFLKSIRTPMTVVSLVLDASIAMQRMLVRGRTDDTPEIIKERFVDFELKTAPVIHRLVDYAHVVYTIDANRTPKEISEEIKTLLGV